MQNLGIFWQHVSLSLFSIVEVLIAFYENRLKDHYVITPSVLQGLRALVSVWLHEMDRLLSLQDSFLHRKVGELFWEVPAPWRWPTCTLCVCAFSRQNVRRCLPAQPCPCWGLCSRMFTYRWDSVCDIFNKQLLFKIYLKMFVFVLRLCVFFDSERRLSVSLDLCNISPHFI